MHINITKGHRQYVGGGIYWGWGEAGRERSMGKNETYVIFSK